FSPKKFISVDDAIAAIRESGGLVQIPHPFVSSKRLGMKVKDFLRLFADHFRNRSIIGLETDYPILDKYLKYYSDYRFGKSKFRDSTKTGAYLLSNEEKAIVTIKEMQEIANEDMHKYVYWLATDPDLDLGFLISELIHFRVSDCHFRKGDDLMHYCSGESECRHLLELKKRLT
ncbi:hypothetical protein KY326_02210, partial [Candidatus Woesearchaeota archaeon]|nr:hypothetical protein [Candidatus Woesearchaeota archaeon]